MDVADSDALPRIPIQIADLAHELWQRANAAAEVELKGGAAARTIVIRTEEAESLRGQVSGLRDQLQRESLAFGELRAQAARYEAMAHNALGRADEADDSGAQAPSRSRRCATTYCGARGGGRSIARESRSSP